MLENLRQLTLGWQMYAGDNDGKLARNGAQSYTPAGPTDPKIQAGGVWYQWCPGSMAAFTPYATNFIQAGAIYPYVNALTVYKCPADHKVFSFGSLRITSARSYSMNCYLAPIAGGEWFYAGTMGTRNFYKDAELNNPGPAMTYVFIGENENSINDGFFVSDPTGEIIGRIFRQRIMVVRRGFRFADGHTEMKRWTDVGILNSNGTRGQFLGDPNSKDAIWLEQRATSFVPP